MTTSKPLPEVDFSRIEASFAVILRTYETLFSRMPTQSIRTITLEPSGPFQTLPGKNYSGRRDVLVRHNGFVTGAMTVVLFRTGDGTGSSNGPYPLESVDYSCLGTVDRPEAALPRARAITEPPFLEFFFPIASFSETEDLFHPGVVSLEQIALDDPSPDKVRTALTQRLALGLHPENYDLAIRTEKTALGLPQLSIDEEAATQGLVHAAWYNPVRFGSHTQIGGFLPLYVGHPLIPVLTRLGEEH